MSVGHDLIGQTFGALVVECRALNAENGKRRWQCRCACGKTTIVRGSSLSGGRTRSCGCGQNAKKGRTCGVLDCLRPHFVRGRCAHHHRKDSIDVIRNKYLLRRFGITLEEYGDMLAEQNGVCAICKRPETDRSNRGYKVKTLSVDHTPGTKQVRALLCRRCNTVLGHAEDSPDLLRLMAAYVEKHKVQVQAV